MAFFTRLREMVEDAVVNIWSSFGEDGEEGGAEVGSNQITELQPVLLEVDNERLQEEFGEDMEEGFLVVPRPSPSNNTPREGKSGSQSNNADLNSISADGLKRLDSRLTDLLEPMSDLQPHAKDQVQVGGAEDDTGSSSEGEGGAEGVESGGLHQPSAKKRALPSVFLDWSSCAAAPVRMKNAQAVFYKGELHVGGGYTGSSKTDATMYTYDVTFDHWNSLPASTPLKWFGLAEFDDQLVLVGGRETKAASAECSNKLSSWDSETGEWTQRLPSMSIARTTPTVFSHRSLLVVAGGKKGALDYNVEVLDGSTMQWMHAASLPLKISPFSSLVHSDFWYLLKAEKGSSTSVQYADIDSFLALPLPDSQPTASHGQASGALWKKLPSLSLISPFRITAVGDFLVAFSHNTSNGGSLAVHAFFPSSETWSYIGKVPGLCKSSTAAVTPRGELILIGGDGGNFQYSDKVYNVRVLATSPKTKKRTRVVLAV